jgi:hypothetical protein
MYPEDPRSAAAFMNSPSNCRSVSAVALSDAFARGWIFGTITTATNSVNVRISGKIFTCPPNAANILRAAASSSEGDVGFFGF